MQQQSNEWRFARCGSVGGSEVPDVMRKGKDGKSPSVSRANLMARKVIERLTGVPVETFKSAAMMNGTAREPTGRLAYEIRANVMVEQVGLIRHPSIEGAHASPDGLIGDLKGVEIKSPEPAAHLETLETEKIDPDYIRQVQWNMACSQRTSWDFVSFNPDFPEPMDLFIKTIERDDAMILKMEEAVRAFLQELDARMAALKFHYRERKSA